MVYIFDAIRIGKNVISKPHTLNPRPWLVTSQDPFEPALPAGVSRALLALNCKFKSIRTF